MLRRAGAAEHVEYRHEREGRACSRRPRRRGAAGRAGQHQLQPRRAGFGNSREGARVRPVDALFEIA